MNLERPSTDAIEAALGPKSEFVRTAAGTGRPYHRLSMADPPSSNPDGLCDLDEAGLRTRVERTLALIRPAIRADGGDVELVSAAPDGLVRIRLLGACIGCPSASMTLHHGIERALRSDLGPSIRVEAVGGRAGG